MSKEDTWLLEPFTHSTNPIRLEEITVKNSIFSKNNFTLQIYHPLGNPNEAFKHEVGLLGSGWTEARLDKLARSMGQIGIPAACFTHPRRDALSDIWSLLVASKKLRTNWNELTQAVWEEKDLERAEHVLIDMLSDQVDDPEDQKSLYRSALQAGKIRRDNLLASIDVLHLHQEDFNVHLLGHSLGGIDATMATMAYHEHIKSLTLAGPGGLMVNDTVHGIIPRVASTVAWERAEFFKNARDMARMAISTVMFIAANPVQTVYEAGAAATSRIDNDLWKILADYRIPTVLVLGEKDKMFPTDIVTKDIKDIPFAGKIILPDAGHNMTLHQADDVARIMGNTILDVANKSSSQLEVNLNNLLYVRRSKRPDLLTLEDAEKDLFSRNDT